MFIRIWVIFYWINPSWCLNFLYRTFNIWSTALTSIYSLYSIWFIIITVFNWHSLSNCLKFHPLWSLHLPMCKCHDSSILLIFNYTDSMWDPIKPLSFDCAPQISVFLEEHGPVILYLRYFRNIKTSKMRPTRLVKLLVWINRLRINLLFFLFTLTRHIF